MLRYFGIERGEFPTVVVAVAPPEDLKKGDMFRLDQSDPSRNLTVLQCQAAPSAASHSSSAGAQAHGHCTERRAASGGDGPVGAGQTCLAGAGTVQLMATVCVGLGGFGCGCVWLHAHDWAPFSSYPRCAWVCAGVDSVACGRVPMIGRGTEAQVSALRQCSSAWRQCTEAQVSAWRQFSSATRDDARRSRECLTRMPLALTSRPLALT